MLIKNETYQLECIDFTHEGLGVCKVDGYPVFVKEMVIGEVGQVVITRAKKNYAYGRLLELEKVSENRVEAPCEIYKQCGGCQIQHMNLDTQKELKQNRVKQAFKKFGETDVLVHEVLEMEDPWYYRNKVQVPFKKIGDEIAYGFYKPRSHDIIQMKECVIQNKYSNKVLETLSVLFKKYLVDIYNEKTHSGNLRHVVTRYGYDSNELMLVFVTKNKKFKQLKPLIEELLELHPEISTIVQNVNPDKTNVILGNDEFIHHGTGYIADKLNGIEFRVSSKSFYQVNPKQTEVLYNEAIKLAELNEEMVVFDMYSGIGTIGLSVANHVKSVYGVEINESAVDDARINARINKIDNTLFECGDVAIVTKQWLDDGIKPDVVFIDPPRKGCSREFLDLLKELDPEKIVYISCDVSTQARDVAILKEFGYSTSEVQPVDLFPQTYHIESVLVLKK
jgi:23S rRNA (uracil1939-C5)-methyltransferase